MDRCIYINITTVSSLAQRDCNQVDFDYTSGYFSGGVALYDNCLAATLSGNTLLDMNETAKKMCHKPNHFQVVWLLLDMKESDGHSQPAKRKRGKTALTASYLSLSHHHLSIFSMFSKSFYFSVNCWQVKRRTGTLKGACFIHQFP